MSFQPAHGHWQGQQGQQAHTPPPTMATGGGGQDGIAIRPMRLKVLYTFDDQNKTNCLARWPHILQIQTIDMEEGATIGIIELKTCIQAIIDCSPELVARIGQDYTVYAYDYSEYDNPLVGQGMLSKVLRTATPNPDVPAMESRQLITGRVCKNILGLFTNGVKETLEVKLRLVPVPTAVQGEYQATMEKFREINKSVPPPGFDNGEWNAFVQSNPQFSQNASQNQTHQSQRVPPRETMSMEVVNQLLSPNIQPQPQPILDDPNQGNASETAESATTGVKVGAKVKKTSSRPSSRASVKRPRKPKAAAATGGNTSGYEECTDGDDGPTQPKKRARTTKAKPASKSASFGSGNESLRVAASTASSLRLFRPIAISPASNAGGHLEEIPRVPTPVPKFQESNGPRNQPLVQSGLRRDSFATQEEEPQLPRPRMAQYPQLPRPEDELIFSIESANPSPERNETPGVTPADIGSSPPVMRTRPPSVIPSSPPCPSSPVLPQMPRTDSGFMSGSLEDLFGEDFENNMGDDDEVDMIETNDKSPRNSAIQVPPQESAQEEFIIHQVVPGPPELLPTRMPVIEPRQHYRAPRSRGGSVMSEDGQVPAPQNSNQGPSQLSTVSQPVYPETMVQQTDTELQSELHPTPQPLQPLQNVPYEHQAQALESQQLESAQFQPPSSQRSRMMARTASMGSLTLPEIPASDPVLPPSSLQRSQTWSELPPHAMSEAPISRMPPAYSMPPGPYRPAGPAMQPFPSISGGPMNNPAVAYSRTWNAKKAAIKQKLEMAIANGEMPPYCSNCGAIETPTWRKAWSQEIQGAPGYYEYSDAPGAVTAVVIKTRDKDGTPTAFLTVKKYLGPKEKQEDFEEFLLCNPCGIWMSKYKTQRPPDRWENGPMDKRTDNKKRVQQRPSKVVKKPQMPNPMPTSEANFPPSDVGYLPSEAQLPQSEVQKPQLGANLPTAGGASPVDTTATQQASQQANPERNERQRSNSAHPPKRLNAMTSNAASDALRRAIQSSPARWQGTRHSPIDVEGADMDSTRRLLFPSPRKEGSLKVLGEMTTNVVQIATDFHPPKSPGTEVDKENCPPAIDVDHADAEFLKLFDEEMARPTTPVQDKDHTNPFKTPTRQSSTHRPVTRSVSRSARSNKSPGHLIALTPSKTPYSASLRRSPRHNNDIFESPFTAQLNQFMSGTNHHHSDGLDFGNLPDLPDMPHDDHNTQIDPNFSIDDLFSTGPPMPSSPPRSFQLYEDPTALNNINWDEYSTFDTQNLQLDEPSQEVVIKEEPKESPKKDTSSSAESAENGN